MASTNGTKAAKSAAARYFFISPLYSLPRQIAPLLAPLLTELPFEQSGGPTADDARLVFVARLSRPSYVRELGDPTPAQTQVKENFGACDLHRFDDVAVADLTMWAVAVGDVEQWFGHGSSE